MQVGLDKENIESVSVLGIAKSGLYSWDEEELALTIISSHTPIAGFGIRLNGKQGEQELTVNFEVTSKFLASMFPEDDMIKVSYNKIDGFTLEGSNHGHNFGHVTRVIQG